MEYSVLRPVAYVLARMALASYSVQSAREMGRCLKSLSISIS
jgi:hypothetical protein